MTSDSRGAELRLERITKTYGEAAAVRGLDLTVNPGEFVTLLGASGSGKTTTLMMLAGFTSPTAGRISIGGRDVTSLPPGKRDLGVVFQNYALFPHLTVSQNLAFPLQMRGIDAKSIAKEVVRALEMVKLSDKGGRFPRELSGGQQQRVALARAIIFKPQALLMDEPLGALDKNLREHMQLEIKRLQKSLGATVVFVTHDQEEALTMSDRVAVMQDGRIAQIASPREVYEEPANRWVASFIGQSNFLPGRIEGRDDGGYVVALDSGPRIRSRGAAGRSVGDCVSGVLRPESIRIAPLSTAPEVGSVSGEVLDVLYFGHTIKYSLRLVDGTTVTAQTTREGQASAPTVGTSVTLSWDVGSVWLVDEETLQ